MNNKKKINQDHVEISLNANNDIGQITEIFNQYGLVIIRGLIDDRLIEELLESAIYFFKQTASKIGINHRDANKLDELDFYVSSLEENDRESASAALSLISKSSNISNITNSKVLDIAAKILKSEKSHLIFESLGVLVPSIPKNNSRLYTYHSESHWLPYRKSFVNVWCPMFRNKYPSAGTMHVKLFSHKDTHEFYEYQGFAEDNSKEFYTQYEVPDTDQYPSLAIEASPGDAVFFHSNLLHRSEINKSKNIGYLYVQRFFNTSKDMTISSNMGLRPYTEDALTIGRKLDDDFLDKK